MKLPLVALLFLLPTALAPAAVLFSYNGRDNNYLSSNQGLLLATGVAAPQNPSTNRPFSTDLLTPATNYTGPAFYGGFASNSGSMLYGRLENNATTLGVTGDMIRFSGDATSTEFEVVIMTDSAPTTLGLDTLIRTQISRNNGDLRLVLRSGVNYYVSDYSLALVNLNPIATQTFDMAGLAAAGFSSYDPATDMTYALNEVAYNPFVTSFDGVGLLISRTGTGQTTYISQIHIETNPVPEPSIAALLVIGLVTLRRRAR